jgi:hypothetical protein
LFKRAGKRRPVAFYRRSFIAKLPYFPVGRCPYAGLYYLPDTATDVLHAAINKRLAECYHLQTPFNFNADMG